MMQSVEEKTFLENYDIHHFDVPLTSVDIVIFSVINDEVHVLITKRTDFPFKGEWAIPGGFIDVKKHKNIEETARVKLKQKTGYDAPYLEQLGATGNGERDPRGWSVTVTYFALVNAEEVIFSGDSSWHAITTCGDIVNKPLAFDHTQLIKEAFFRLRSKAQYTTIALHVLPEKFTLSELQKVFEVILGGQLNKSGFRRRISKSNVVIELSGELKQTSTRMAQLYKKSDEQELHFYMREIYAR